MNREETIKLLSILSAAYPNFKVNDPKTMASVWEMSLGEFSAESVYKAARYYIDTKHYPPSPSDLRENIVRGELIYSGPPINAIKAHNPGNKNEEAIEEYLDKFCKWIGFGCEPDDNVILPNFLPYEK